MVTVYQQKTSGGKKCYLVSAEDVRPMIDIISSAQSQAGFFRNVSTAPYSGKSLIRLLFGSWRDKQWESI